MRYFATLFILSILFSCTEKGREQSPPEALQPTAESEAFSEPDAVEESQSGYSDPAEENPPTATFPEFAKRTIEALPDSIHIDGDKVIYGDFNADEKEDFSSTFKNTKNGKQGIIIIHDSDRQEYHVFGGGQLINGMDNLNWIDIFEPMPKGQTVAATLVDPETGDIVGEDLANAVILKGNGIYMHVDEAGGGGILYWDGSKYNWLHLE